jgi:hemerythrin
MAKNTPGSGPFIQEHHKRLIEMYNTLSATIGREKPENRERMVAGLLDYAIYHFRVEAEAAAKRGYVETTWDSYDREMLEKRAIEIKEQVKRKEVLAGSDLLLRLRDLLRTHLARENGPLISAGLKL